MVPANFYFVPTLKGDTMRVQIKDVKNKPRILQMYNRWLVYFIADGRVTVYIYPNRAAAFIAAAEIYKTFYKKV